MPTATRFAREGLRLASGLAVGLVVLIVMVTLLESSFLYYPTRYPEGDWTPPEGPFEITDVTFTTEDGIRLHAWWTESPGATMTLLWSHGNAGNLSHRSDLLARLAQLPANVLLYDYRGYGKSEGTPSEQGLYRDVRAGYSWLQEEQGVSPRRIVAFGKSLGAAVAIDLAAEVECGGLIVQSAFTNTPEMAQQQLLPLVPWSILLRQKFDSLAKIGRVRCAVLVIHGRGDTTVPFDHGQRLFAAAPEPKHFLELPTGDHNYTPFVDPQRYDGAIRDFLREIETR